jgi:hypothetical protein
MRNNLIGKRLKTGEFTYKTWCYQPVKAHSTLAPSAHTLLIVLAVAFGFVIWINFGATLQAQAPDSADTPTIVGGHEAEIGAWPWQAALVDADDPDAAQGQFCGGSLIAPTWVLTAAHCVEGESAAAIEVVLGRHRLSSPGGERLAVDTILIHPAYRSYLSGSDLALLHLVEPSIQIPLPIDNDVTVLAENRSLRATVTGWGATDTATGSEVLREASIPLVTRNICNAGYFTDDLVTPEMICAGYPKGGKGSCYGDSGGPLMIATDEAPGWLEVGIVSWGPSGCRSQDQYGVYTRVASFQPWIQQCLDDLDAADCIGGDDYEPDDQPAQASQIASILNATSVVSQSHTLHDISDTDWVKLGVSAGATYIIETQAVSALGDTILWLYQNDGIKALAYDDDSGDDAYGARLIWRAPANDTVYIQVESYWRNSRIDYILHVTELNAAYHLPIILQP